MAGRKRSNLIAGERLLMKTYDKGDTLPEPYRQCLIKLMAYQADSEYIGALRVAENHRFAPRPEEAYRLSKKVMEGMGHSYYVWSLLRDLGIDVDTRFQELVSNPDNPDPAKVSVINAFRKPNWSSWFECWEDMVLFLNVVTPAAVEFLGQYRDSSFLPWARVNARIYKEEQGHLAFGLWAAKHCLTSGGEAARELMQCRIERFIAIGLGFFGRPSCGSNKSETFEMYHEYGLKPKRPEDLQADYLTQLERRLGGIGLILPAGVEADYDMRANHVAGAVCAAPKDFTAFMSKQ